MTQIKLLQSIILSCMAEVEVCFDNRQIKILLQTAFDMAKRDKSLQAHNCGSRVHAEYGNGSLMI